jgi:glyoxylase-like metal-dependent hydrolase (beta-lactamase superfamily II)
MPLIAPELLEITPSLFIWQAFDPAARVELFSTSFVLRRQIVIVDPVRLESSQLSELRKRGCIAGVVVTNANHHRAATWYSQEFSAPIFALGEGFHGPKPGRRTEVRDASKIVGQLEVVEIEGAVAGELALYHAADGGTLVVGDALINFEPYGFAFLPRKYCRDEKQMRRSLGKLLDRPAERMFFAHGMPVLAGATARLRQLIEADV